jgi:hypothetical protein
MKKIGYFFMILTVMVGLVACNQQKEEVKQKSNVTEPNNDNEINKEVSEKSQDQKLNNENPITQNGSELNDQQGSVYQNEVFKDVVVSESENKIIVTGKAQVFEGVFQYALYDNEKVLKQSNYQTEGAPAWGEFKITFDKEFLITRNTRFELFVYSAKDGSKVNTLEIPLLKH